MSLWAPGAVADMMSPSDNGTWGLPPWLKGEGWQAQEPLIISNHRCLETARRKTSHVPAFTRKQWGKVSAAPDRKC